MRRREIRVAAALLLAFVACSEEALRAPSGQSMAVEPATVPGGVGDEHAPVVELVRFDPLKPKVDGVTRAVVEAHDPDGDRVELRYEWRVNGGLVVSTDPMIDTHGLGKGDRLEVSVVASDGRNDSAPFVRGVAIGNRPPLVSFVGITPARPSPGEPLEAEVSAVDEDGGRLGYRYQWFVNGVLDAQDRERFDTGALSPGDVVQLKVAASDGSLVTRPTGSAPVRIGASRAPEITSQPGAIREDGEFHYTLEARDPEGETPLRFELLEGPDGMTLDERTGELVWIPRDDQEGVHTVDVKVSDPHGQASAQRFVLEVRLGGGAPPASPR